MRLTAFFRWTFAGLSWLTLVASIALVAVIVINPPIQSGGNFSANVSVSTDPGTLMLQAGTGSTKLSITELHATVSGSGDDGFVRLFKRYGLPLALLYTVFATVLFDLLRRLFRNVQHGDSFTPGTVRLVRVIGYALLVYSLVSAAVETLFSAALLDYLRAHVTGPGLAWVATPGMHSVTFPMGAPVFFSGLLVLALSEVFRQGLKLKADSDLTI